MAVETPFASAPYSVERRHPRYFFSAPMSTWHLGKHGPQITRGLSLEISMGGLSAVLCGPPRVGERVSVRLKMLGSSCEALAIVRHSHPARTGFEFLELPPEFFRTIESCIQQSLPCPLPHEIGVQV